MNFKLMLETKKQKITALIIAIVSVILCVAIVLVSVSSCSVEESGGKTVVKKVVKKKVIIVQKPETSTDGEDDRDKDQNTYYDIVDEDYDGPEEVVDTVFVPEENDETVTDNSDVYESDDTETDDVMDESEEDLENEDEEDDSKEETDSSDESKEENDSSDDSDDNSSEEEGSQYEVELNGKIKTPMSDKIAFGFWNYRPGSWTSQFGDKYGKEVDFLTTCDIYNADEAKWCKENGISGWIKTLGSFENGTDELKQSYKDNMISTAEAYKALGVWNVIEGFHFDEPLLKLSGEQFRNLTKFLAETFPDKRIYPVCCNYEVRGYGPTNTYDAISYYNCGYITDIGYDNYGSVDIETQREYIQRIKEQVGRKDVRIWLFPTTFRQFAGTDEDYMIEHLNMYYDLLMEQENPGGLHMFSWGTYGTMTGFKELTDPELNWNYTRLFERVLEIGKELKNTKYTYKTTKN